MLLRSELSRTFALIDESSLWSRVYQGMFDLSKVYLPELLEHVSAGEVLEADSNLSTCINFTVFSFIMAYNNKNAGGLFACNFTFCLPNHNLRFSKFPVFKNILIYPIRFYVFWR